MFRFKNTLGPSNRFNMTINKTENTTVKLTNKEIIQNYFKNTTKKYHIAFYNTFPEAKNAEFELLMRLENICNKYNIGYFIIYITNEIQNTELKGININEIDVSDLLCCISLHYYSPKTSKHFSLLTLWNPIKFYSTVSLDKAYKMDGYLSAHSNYIDDFIKSHSDKPFLGFLNTSTDGPILDLTFGEYNCFYAGMNWNISTDSIRVNIFKLIKFLDNSPILYCYGLRECWKGYRSYKGEIPFDGISIIKEIHNCGICLVLSSSLHIAEGVCSCRLFEGLAAGVPIIADKNPFFQEWFGDNIFYIDTDDTLMAAKQVCEYINFFKSNPEETMTKMKNCRKIFLENFLLDKQLLQVVENVKEYKLNSLDA